MCFISILLMTLLMHKIYSSEAVLGSLGLDASDESSSSDHSSDHNEEVVELGDLDEEDKIMPMPLVTEPEARNECEIQDLETGCE
jgi:hypothetical protein